MNNKKKISLFILGGSCGIAGTVCYVLTGLVTLNQSALFLLAISWPVFSIIFVYSLYKYISTEYPSAANQLAFLFACLAFTLVACMLSVQLAVQNGIEKYIADTPDKKELLNLIKKSIRMVDQGIDVAWDIFIGISLFFLSFALKKSVYFGIWWGVLSGLLGILLIILNVITFPWPPDTQGLFDIGPFIGIYIIALSSRLLWLGYRMKK